MTRPVTIWPLTGIPDITAGDDLAEIIATALASARDSLIDGDILVVSSKIASKAAGLVVTGDEARDKDSLVRRESEFVVAERRLSNGRITRVVKALAGPIMAAAGIDGSNTGGVGDYLLLPHDPDAVCRELHSQLAARFSGDFGVLLTDTSSRPWRLGVSDFALGASGVRVLEDLRGAPDADGRVMEVTTRAIADEIASAADLVKGKTHGVPVAIVRGLARFVVGLGRDLDSRDPDGRDPQSPDPDGHDGARGLVRTGRDDWFAYGRAEAVRAALGAEPGSTTSEAVGIAPVSLAETLAERIDRAVRLAVLDTPGIRIESGPTPTELTVRSPDAFRAGRVLARLDVALWSEWLTATVTSYSDSTNGPNGRTGTDAKDRGEGGYHATLAVRPLHVT